MREARLAIAVLLFAWTSLCNAGGTLGKPEYYGRYNCPACNVQAGWAASEPDIITFIESTKITTMYVKNDSMTICNGTACQDIYWNFGWFAKGTPYQDNQKSYKNDTSGNNDGPCSIVCVLQGGAANDYYWTVQIIWTSPLTGTVTIQEPPQTLLDTAGAGPSSGEGSGSWGWDTIPPWYNVDPTGNGGGLGTGGGAGTGSAGACSSSCPPVVKQ